MTGNHDYETPDFGTSDWHLPLNTNFERIDTDIEIRDTDSNRADYTPKKGSKFLSTDTGRIYLGDGEAWNEIGNINGGSGVANGGTYVDTSDDVASLIENASRGEVVSLLAGTHQANSSITIQTDNVTVHIPTGATLVGPDSVAEEERFIRVEGDDVVFRGKGTIDGNLSAVPTPSGRGHEHILQVGDYDIDATRGFTLDGLTLQNAPGGDCIYINNVVESQFRNFVADSGYRNCVSVINGRDLVFDNFRAINADGQNPQSGFGMEPNGVGEELNRIHVTNGVFENNTRSGFYINSSRADDAYESDIIDVLVENCYSVENGRGGSSGFLLPRAKFSENIKFVNCHARRNGRAGWHIGGAQKVRLENCTATANGQHTSGSIGSGVFANVDQEDDVTPAKVVVSNFEVYDEQASPTQKRPGVALDGCSIRVIEARVGPHAGSSDGFEAKSGATIEHRFVDVESGDSPAVGSGETVRL